MELTNKQIQAILDGTPEGATHYAQGMHYLAYNSSGIWMRYDPSGIGGFCWFDANEFKFSYTKSFHSLSDLGEILELRRGIDRYSDGDIVPIPKSRNMAKCMAGVAIAWLEQNAPDALSDVARERDELAATVERLKYENDKLLSKYGDNWYDGFMAAREYERKKDNGLVSDLTDDEILTMSEHVESEYANQLREQSK